MSDQNTNIPSPGEAEFFNPDDFAPADPIELDRFNEDLKNTIIQRAQLLGKYEEKFQATIGINGGPAETHDDEPTAMIGLELEHKLVTVEGQTNESFSISRAYNNQGKLGFRLSWNTGEPGVSLWRNNWSNEPHNDEERTALLTELDIYSAECIDILSHGEDPLAESILEALTLTRSVLNGELLEKDDIAKVVQASIADDRERLHVVHAEVSSEEDGNETVLQHSDVTIKDRETLQYKQESLHIDILGASIEGQRRQHLLGYDSYVGFNSEVSDVLSKKSDVKFADTKDPDAIPNESTPKIVEGNAGVIGGAAIGLSISGLPEYMEHMAREFRNDTAGVYDVTKAKLARLKALVKTIKTS